MPAVLGLALILGLGLLLTSSSPRKGLPQRRSARRDDPDESLSELAARDPIEALRRYGTPEDAVRLGGNGIDLGGLGYHAPGER